MATATELLTSRRRSTTEDGKSKGERVFRVAGIDTAGVPESLTVEDALIPISIDVGDEWPDDPSLKATHYNEGRRLEGHNDLVQITWQYSGVTVEPLLNVGSDQTRKLVKAYRIDPELFFPPGGDVEGEHAHFSYTDVGGYINDIVGFRQSVLLYNHIITFTEITGTLPDLALFGQFVGTRNSTPWFGSAVGQSLYVGARARTAGRNGYSITHQFIHDQWFHMVQIAQRDQSGRIKLITEQFFDVTIRYAESVYWRQPFVNKSDFSLLSDLF